VEEAVDREINLGDDRAPDMVWTGSGWLPDAGAMLRDLGVADGATFTVDFYPATLEALTALWKRQKATEAALDRLFPGWQMGPAACLPNCQGACCQD
jgi:hypothetical protein